MLQGIEANPRSSELAFELGFMYYVRPGGRDLAKAAEYFEIASHLPDAPPQAARFAAFARQNSGNLFVSLELWSVVHRTSQNPYVKEAAERELQRITAAIAAGKADLATKKLGAPQVRLER